MEQGDEEFLRQKFGPRLRRSRAPRVRQLVRAHMSPAWRYRARNWVNNTPGVAELYSKLDEAMRVSYPGRDTQLVLDGYPRCGNSYARAAFDYANGNRVSVASHAHSYRAVQVAVRREIP